MSTAAQQAKDDGTVLKLQKLDPRNMRDSCLVCLVSQKGGGKTTMLKDLIYAKRHLPAGVCFTASGESNGEYDTIFPKMFIYNTCNLAQFEEIYRYQTSKNVKYARQFTKEEKQEYARQGVKIETLPKEQKYVKDPSIVVVLEDMLADRKLFNKQIVRELAMNGRHQNMFALLTCQYIKDLPIPIRQNVDYWFLFAEGNDSVRHELYEMFGKVHLKTYALFAEMMDVATQDHKVLFVDARDTSGDPLKKFMWYKANINLAPFRLGSDRYWRFAKKNYKAPDVANRVIVSKYASRMASTRDLVTESELEEVAEREALAAGGAHNRKRKRAAKDDDAVIRKPKARIVLDDERKDAPDEPDNAAEEMFEDLPASLSQ